MMRVTLIWMMALLPALLLGACGGAGSGSDPSGVAPGADAPASVEGLVLDVNGESSDVGGVPLVLGETGEVVVTTSDGAFAFPAVPSGDLTLALATAPTGARLKGDGPGNDAPEPGEDERHGENERHGGRAILGNVQPGERVRVEVRIEDARFTFMSVTRTRSEGGGGSTDACRRHELELEMQRTDANPDPDMSGEVELEVDCDGQRFEVEVENAEPGLEFEAVVVDPEDNAYSLGRRTVEIDGDAEWRIDTGNGGTLPFVVESIRALENYRVIVRDADATLMAARVPELPPSPGAGICGRLRARSRLLAENPVIEGYVELKARGCDGTGDGVRQVFKIEAEHLAPGRVAEFFLEDPANRGTLVSIGSRTADAEGKAELELDTGDGANLPFGVASLRALIGLEVEVTDGTGALLLRGTVPELVQD